MVDPRIEERLNNLFLEIPFLESLKDSHMNKIVQVLKDKSRHSLLNSERLDKIERLVNNYKKTIKTEINEDKQEKNQTKNDNPKITEYIELCDDSSDDEEIEFYEVNDKNEKAKPPNPTKDDILNIKTENNEKQDDESDSDLEIISCSSHSSQMENLERPLISEKLKTEPDLNEADICEDLFKIKEEVLFTRRNNEKKAFENDKDEETDPQKVSNIATNLQEISDTIQLLDSDEEDIQISSPNKENNTKISTLTSNNTTDTNKLINNKIDSESEQTSEKLSELDILKDAVGKCKQNTEKSIDALKADLEKNFKQTFDNSNSISDSDNQKKINNYENSEKTETPTTENQEDPKQTVLGEQSLNELQKIRLNLEKNLFASTTDKNIPLTDNAINRDPRLNKQNSPTNLRSNQSFDQNVSASFNPVNLITAFSPLTNCSGTVLPMPLLPVTTLQMPPSIHNPVTALQMPSSIQNQVPALQIPPLMQNPIRTLQMPPSIQNQVTALQMTTPPSLLQNPITNLQITPHLVRNSSYSLNMIPVDNSLTLPSNTSVTSQVNNQLNKSQNSFINNIPPAPHYSREGIIKSLEGSHLITSQTKVQEQNKQYNSNGSLYTKSRISYGEYKLQQQREAKLRAEREAHERALRQAEQLGLNVNNNNQNLEKKTEANVSDQTSSIKNSTKQKCNEGNNSTHNVESDNNTVIKKKRTLSLKKGRITGLSDSSSEDESEEIQKRLNPRKQISKQNKDLNKLEVNLEQSESMITPDLCTNLIGALRQNLGFLSDKQLENVQEIVESFMKNNPDKNISTLSNNLDSTAKINLINDKMKEKTGKSTNISRELRHLQEQLEGFYDRDEIMSIAGKNRISSTIALEKIIRKVDIEKSQADDELSKSNENHPQNSSTNTKKSIKLNNIEKSENELSSKNLNKPNEMHQKLLDLERIVKKLQIEKGLKQSHLTQPIFDEDENRSVKEDEYDTDDFTPHYKEFISPDNKKVIKRKKFHKKELKIILKKIKPKKEPKIKTNNLIPLLKPLITITDLPESEKQTRKPIKLRNTNINHHCLNKNIMNKCLYCYKTYSDTTNNIVAHYVNSHSRRPGHEVYCSRLPSLLIKKYKDNPPMGQLLQKDPYKYEVECIFCNIKVIGFHKELEEHYATHTGEFAWQCSCNKKYAYKKDIINHCKSFCRERNSKFSKIYCYKKENQISGVYCTECNYIQLNKSNVIRHLQNHHLITREPERLCENLILVTFFRSTISNSMENPEFTKYINEINENDFFINEYENIDVNNMTIIDQKVDKLIADNNHNTTGDKNKIFNQFELMDTEIDIKPTFLDGFQELDEIFKEANLQIQNINDNETINIKKENDIILTDYNGEVIHIDTDDEDENNGNEQGISTETIPTKPIDFIDLDKKILLKPWLSENNTDEQISIKILSQTNLSNFYKCMLCPFSTNTDTYMLNHMNHNHNLNENPIDCFECCYCAEKLNDSLELINHIKTEHFGCNFQCSECFYRSVSPFNVKLHIQMYHKKSTKILFCDGPEIPILNLIKVILESREQNLKPFTCHLCCGGETTKFYIEDDFVNHIKTYHYNIPYCKCDQHKLLCCIFCNFESNSIEQIQTHMTDAHSNRDQYIAARFRNPKFKRKELQKVKSITGKSTVIVFLSEVLQERYFVPSHNLKQKLQKIREEKKNFNLKLSGTSETFWNVKCLTKEIQNYKQLKSDNEYMIEQNVSIEEYQNEFYEMAEIAVSQTGFEGKNLYKCILNNCQTELENFGQWFNHIKTQHEDLLNKLNKCPHCPNQFKIQEFQNHLFTKHTIHKYFCYLCARTDSTVTALERHLQIEHRIVRAKTEIIIPHKNYFAVVPYDLFNDKKTILIHMRNILKLARYHIKIQNNDEYFNNNNPINNKKSLKLPKFIILQNRYKCCESNYCSYNFQSENMLENHLKGIHRCLKSFKCLHCSYKINVELRDFECIKDHLRLHAETLFVCTKCNFYHHQRKIVQNHIRSVHKLQITMSKITRSHRNGMEHYAFEIDLEEGNIFLSLNSCLICEEDLIEPDKAIEHLNEKHLVTVFYECQYCKVLYYELDEIIEHIGKDHGKGINMRCKFEYNKSEQEILKEKNMTETLTLKRLRPETDILKHNLENMNQLFKKIKTEKELDNYNEESNLSIAAPSLSNQQNHNNKESSSIHIENNHISQNKTITSPTSLKPKPPCIRVRPIESLIYPDYMVKIPNQNNEK